MAEILDGKKISKGILNRLKKEISESRLKLKLVAVYVGKNSVSEVYIRKKQKICEKTGVGFELAAFPGNIKQDALKNKVKGMARDAKVSGIIIQLPLPKSINVQEILDAVPSEKDPDCLSSESLGKFYAEDFSVLPPVAAAVSELLRKNKIDIKGKNAAIVGAGRLVGKPLALWFLKEKATVSILNEFTKNMSYFTKNADILVSGVGRPGLIKGFMVKRRAVVIDAGTSAEGKNLKGDIDFKSVSKKAGFITPVPGGVGPLTVSSLLKNLLLLNSKNANRPKTF